jgi:MFS family permease
VGINAVVIYGTDIAASVFENLKNLIPVIMNLEQTLTCLVTSYLLTKLGRKQILQGGTAVGIASLILIGAGFLLRGGSDHPDDTTTTTVGNVMILIGLVIFMADFGLSLGPVVWLYIPEILEPDLIAFSTGANWGAATLITILFPILKKAFGTPAPLFLFYAAYCLLGFLFSQKYVIETKGKSEKEIYDEYEKLTQ